MMEIPMHTTDRIDDKQQPQHPARRPEPEEPLPPAEPVPDGEVDAFLRDPSLRFALTAAVLGRVRRDDVEDVVQEAMFAVKRARRLPTEPTQRLQYALAIARNKARKWYRRKQAGRPESVEFNEEQTPAALDCGLQRTADREHIERIVATVPEKHRSTLICLARYLMGESIADMAREMGVKYETLHKRVTALRERMESTGKAIAGLALVLMLLIVMVRPKSGHEVSAPRPPDQPERALDLRKHGFEQCMRNDWSSCESDLDAARDLDPDGEDDPKVQAARADVKAAAEHHDEPSWSPKGPRLYDESAR
jgi:RNA polymerase sigma factor (sigma-70 family)